MPMRSDFEHYFRDPETNLMFTSLDRDTLRPPDDAFFAQGGLTAEEMVDGVTPAELYMHENFGIATGSYMASEALRYEATGAADALESMHRSLDGMFRVYEMGRQLSPGFYPKIYGRRFSRETSTDQVLYSCLGMEAFHPYAGAEDRRKIEEMIPAMLRFWAERDYRYHYFHYFGDDWQWPLIRFPGLLKLAWKFSGDDFFDRECRRLLPQTVIPEHCQLLKSLRNGKPSEYERANHAWLTINGADRIGMDVMQYDLLLRHDPENPLACYWRAGIRWMWEEVKDSIADDGFYYSMTLYDFDTLKCRQPPGWSVDGSKNHGAKSAWSTWVARAGLVAMRHCPELRDEVLPVAEKVLEKITFNRCLWYLEPDHFPPEQRFNTRMLSGDAVANYLWTQELLGRFRREHPQHAVQGCPDGVKPFFLRSDSRLQPLKPQKQED